jgi:hypothetical protein
MKNLLIILLLIIFYVEASAQYTQNPYGDFTRKKIYNYITGELFLNSPAGRDESQSISAIRYTVCFTNGKYHQFGIGSGIVSHTAAADTARVNYIGIPIYISNRFYFTDPELRQTCLYLECHGGYHLPISGTYQSGNREGQPVPAFLPKGTGFFGFTFGARIPLVNNTAFIMEFIYRDQHVPYPGKENFYPHFVGLGCGVSF